MYTTYLSIKKTFCFTHKIQLRISVFAEKRAINFLTGFNNLLFAMEKQYVFWEVEARVSNFVYINFVFQKIKARIHFDIIFYQQHRQGNK